MGFRFVVVLSLLLALSLSGCSWMEPDPAQELARIKGGAPAYVEALQKQLGEENQDAFLYYQLAWAYHFQGQNQEALTAVKTALNLKPLSPKYRLLAGQIEQDLGDHFAAVSLFSSALKLDNRLLEGYLGLAKSLEATGKPQDALVQLELALAIEPLYFEAHLAWVRVSLLDKEHPKDLSLLVERMEEALKIKPNSQEGTLLLAQLYQSSGAGFRSRLLLEDWLARFGEDERMLGELARDYAQSGEEEEALLILARQKNPDPGSMDLKLRLRQGKVSPEQLLTELQEELKKNPGSISLMLFEAEMLYNLGQYDQAERSLQKVLRFEPKNAKAYLGLAKVYVGQSDYRGEEQALDRALALAPGSLEVRLSYLESLVRRGLFAEASAQVNQLKLEGENRRLLLLKGYLAQQRGDYAEAEEWIKKAQKQGTDLASQLALAKLEIARGQEETGIARAKEAFKLQPEDMETRLVLAQGYLAAGQDEALEELLKPLVSSHRGEGRAHLILARSRLNRGQLASAAGFLEDGLKTWPRQPDMVQLYTAVLGFLGRYKEAIPVLEEMQRFNHRYSELFGYRLWEFYQKAGMTRQFNQYRLPSDR
ncbi:MAG: hypothetical protein A2600_10680 [Candidatus Lambdaproteobacteria bacterium RIFOXYD1_FULL_56_27]|uniref:Tetratricopeptide repeat-like domain-containing protein n=1 Tax=Candidatus Lambdaproteobacteria bacterium RIFOXYD2_FULL_56_26 TaxID=1817773 RepID=A0A1F6GZ57_9PROT|nr:MAG: hypothetical protein A2426_01125 [Candidatus Lambdaproteobacteria bacterium RIFOXYC1_FULL_56_13]OGH03456.1 MAG: hypothetical protein A2557_01740 [Candidatus Lambdaproteobacteria bacterium RIFOXYD2_FULL_56_26]OGH08241.1 MAG: hypothetical protein A2600_10680 [Candidatus Lambdaproteobacteria bacterium RIFOXYD1_FULL_56_27]